MTMLTKADILAADDKPRTTVEVEAWGGTVTIRSLSGADTRVLDMLTKKDPKDPKDPLLFMLRLVQVTVIDPKTGDLMFTPEEIDAIGGRSVAALKIVFDAAAEHNALTKEDQDEMLGN